MRISKAWTDNRLFSNSAQLAALAAASGGLFALFGWISAVSFFTSFATRYIPMALSTAFIFMLLGTSIFLHCRFPHHHIISTAGMLTGLLTIVTTLLLLYFSIQNIYLPFENLGISESINMKSGMPIGHMSPLTALAFTFIAAAFCLTLTSSNDHPEFAVYAFYISCLVAMLAIVLILGYFTGKPVMYSSGLIPPAMPTALAFLFLSLALALKSSLSVWPAGTHLPLVLSTLPPLAAAILQWIFWPYLNPLLWFLFYPAVFFSAWMGGIAGGVSAAVISIALVSFFFIPPEFSFMIAYPRYLFAFIIFIGMGILFGYIQENLRKARIHAAEALAEAQAARNQLQLINKELESFSNSVSHDLRAPLRAVTGFSDKLEKHLQDRLDAEGRRLIRVIVDNGKKMGQLINDLLAFSHISHKEMNYGFIDMEMLAGNTFKEIQSGQKNRSCKFELQKLPPAWGDPALIGQVFYNLLANAVKFSRNNKHAVVKVGCKDSGDEQIYYVRDNGAGFSMKYADKLFGVFQRLHSESEFEGTGIGLSLVQRIIHRHGGRVWAEGVVKNGATFYFSLPKKEKSG